MKKRRIKNITKEIIADKMKRSPLSRIVGMPVYSAGKDRLSEEDAQKIQDKLLRKGILCELQSSHHKFYLKITMTGKFTKIKSYLVNAILLFFTIITTTVIGAIFQGKDPFVSRQEFSSGFEYSFALLTILLVHEMAHYFTARYYKVDTTLPYFVPLFFPGFHPGTLGAFIKIRSLIPTKKALFDIGISGPLAGFIASVVFLIIGFRRLPDIERINQYISHIHYMNISDGIKLTLGHTLVFDWISNYFGGARLSMSELYHFPFIFAGWFGLIVTAINLFPIGQLDGGHISYALFGRKSRGIAYVFFFSLLILTVYLIINYSSYIWVLWVILIFFLIRFSHPPTLNDRVELGFVREMLGRLAFVILVISFSPMPIFVTN